MNWYVCLDLVWCLVFLLMAFIWLAFRAHRLSCLTSTSSVCASLCAYCVSSTYKSIHQEREKEREMGSEKNSARVWVRQNAPVKIYSSISVNVWERKSQLICILLYYSLFLFAPLLLHELWSPFCIRIAQWKSIVNIIWNNLQSIQLPTQYLLKSL